MKWILFFCLLITFTAQAAQPSRAAIFSCMSGYSVSPKVTLVEFPTNEINVEDDYKSGYHATFYIKVDGKDIGYAEKNDQYGIIYADDIYPVNGAKRLLNTKLQASDFNPSLASWSKITDATSQYLCVSFNFDGIGRSGSFQKVRGAYLLSIETAQHSRKLFFAVANIDSYSKK